MASSSNATLSYKVSDESRSFPIWVMEFSQPLMLNGTSAQSRTRKHFYPRSHMPGDIAVKGRCESQHHYQELAQFIRKHQRELVDMPATERFTRIDTTNPGYHRLLRLSIPHEPVYVRGWIDNFSISKRGVHAPAPEFNFSFFVVFDQSARDIGISHRIQKYYNSAYAPNKKAKDPFFGSRQPDHIGSVTTDSDEDRRGGA